MVGLINKEDIYNIADAIREKLQIEDTFKPSEMAELILSITGEESGIIPIAGALSYEGIERQINITPITGTIVND